MAPTELLSLATLAATCVRAHPATTKDRLVLLGHSMGGQRSCAQAADDPAVVGLVLLAPAQMTRTGPNDSGRNLNQLEAHAQLKAQDTNGDGQVQGAEIPESSDLDKDGTLRLWEASAILARVQRAAMPPQEGPDSHGIPFGEDALAKRSLPTLVLYGSLDDAQSHHAPILQDLIDAGTLTSVEVRILPGIGHQLGARCDVPHGETSAVMMQHVMKFNLKETRAQQAWVAEAMGVDISAMSEAEAAAAAAAEVLKLVRDDLGLPWRLRDVGVTEEDFGGIAKDAMEDLIVASNPRKVESNDQVIDLLRTAW